MRIREPWPIARTRQRRREFAALFDGVPPRSLGDALELGGGDGFLASLLAPYCRWLATSDSYRPRLASGAAPAEVPRLVCDATALPFADRTLDLIFSSSMLEHVRDRRVAFAEMQRCLRPDGMMVHIMPSRAWKLLQMLLYYPSIGVDAVDFVLDHLSGRAKREDAVATDDRWSDAPNRRVSLGRVLRSLVPAVHGEYRGHRAEWLGFGVRAWVRELRAADFDVHHVLLLPLYSGYGFGCERLRRIGERLGLSAHNAFVVSHAGASPDGIQWFEQVPARRLRAPWLIAEPGSTPN